MSNPTTIELTVNEVKVDNAPSAYSLTYEDVNESNRTADGTTYQTRLATKRIIEVSYSHLTDGELKAILKALELSNPIKLIYYDATHNQANANGYVIGYFFMESRNVSILKMDGNKIIWENLSLVMREQ